MKTVIIFLFYLLSFNIYSKGKSPAWAQVFTPGEYTSLHLEFCSSGKLEITKTGLRLGQSIFFTAIGKPAVLEKSGPGLPSCTTKRKTEFDAKLKIVQEKSETTCQDSSNNSVASSVLKKLKNKLLYVGLEKLTVNSKTITRKVRCEFIKK
jgi:hypothetical protein